MRLFADNMFVSLARTAWTYAAGQRGRMMLFYALFLTANGIISMQPVVLAHIIDTAQKGGADAMHSVLLLAGLYGGITMLFWILHGPARVIERRLAFNIYRDFVVSLYRKVTEMPLRWHQDHHSGGTINRVNKAGKALFTFSQSQFVILQTAMRFATSLVVLVCYSWWVAAASIASSFIIVAIVRRYDRTLIPLVRLGAEREHHLNAGLYDYIGNIITVLTLRMQNNTGTEISHRFEAIKPGFWRETVINEGKWGTVSILLIITQTSIVGAYVAMRMTTQDALTVGPVVAIFQYLLNINLMFFQGMLTYEQTLYQHTDVRGVDGLLADHARLHRQTALEAPRAWQNIRIENLCFTHHEGEDVFHHLRDVKLDIHAGRKIALIGASGSGKTTMLTLLRGLYDTQQVRLTLDADRFETLAPLSGFTTLVPQDSEIFENTVLYNLTLGTDVPDEIVQQALHITTFDEVVPKLPQGIVTDIRERGVNLSGGQKQRLALARGLVAARDSSLLLLDEPTSSVDLPTEGIVFDRLFAAFAAKTIVASIHRLHLLPRFDVIGLMQDGELIEQGGFAELLARRGAFYELWQRHLEQSASHGEDV